MNTRSEHAQILIVGGGFSGIGMAIRLMERGIDDFVILDRAPDVGGTWQVNDYPGCRCDVPSHLYSFSFAPNPEWSQTYSARDEIRNYLRDVADRFGVRPHLRTGVEVTAATWQEDAQRWDVETSQGHYTANVVVSAMGPLTEPKIPDIPGLDSFDGEVMHSARWNHDYDLSGKRVASIGTGASAIQYVPEVQPIVEQLYVLQRTAPWVIPHQGRSITDAERALYRSVPAAQKLVRGAVYGSKEVLIVGLVKKPELLRVLEKLAGAHRRRQISDPVLRERVTPDYALGCKRIVPSNRWYRALAAPNVELVTAGLRAVNGRQIIDTTGTAREVDAIIFGTGFHVTDMPAARQVRGRGGVLLADVWQGSPRAYLGTSIPGFPNFFMLLGPNTGLGHSSMVYMIESQLEHVSQAIGSLLETGATTIEVRPEAHRAFNAEVDARMRGTVWDVGGCTSFYLDASGRNATLWPDWTWRFRRKARHFDRDAYLHSTQEPAVVTR